MHTQKHTQQSQLLGQYIINIFTNKFSRYLFKVVVDFVKKLYLHIHYYVEIFIKSTFYINDKSTSYFIIRLRTIY